MRRLFGEPAALVGAIEALLALLLSWQAFGLTAELIALIMAVVTAALGLYTAYATKDTLLGAVVGLIKAVAALGAGYGLALTPDRTSALIALVTVMFGFIQRAQTEVAEIPAFRDERHTGGAAAVRPMRGSRLAR